MSEVRRALHRAEHVAFVRKIFARRFVCQQRTAGEENLPQIRTTRACLRPFPDDSAKNARRLSSPDALRLRHPAQIVLVCHFILPRKIDNGRFYKIETFNPRCHAHYLRVDEEADLDDEIALHLKHAYAVGQQKHLA
jgi:predicted RNase H-related nuclease YkuK (DUF458 family)